MDAPDGTARAHALFAHCFTCSKDIFAASRIAQTLVERGIAVLRFDFTGLGHSEGEFANTDFSSNVQDLVAAADWLRRDGRAPALLVGHSLGGAAALVAAAAMPEVRAVATIGAPSDVAHVAGLFRAQVPEIEATGEALVQLAGRSFRIRREFLADAAEQNVREHVAALGRALLVLHSPVDDTVAIGNATGIFVNAKHPKSFVSLADADHLLRRRSDAVYAANIIAAWSERYLP
jgi:putative redox protein